MSSTFVHKKHLIIIANNFNVNIEILILIILHALLFSNLLSTIIVCCTSTILISIINIQNKGKAKSRTALSSFSFNAETFDNTYILF